ncbi:E3 UFM1-protein ligase 1 [Carpediemonas membranifera]|uniref:E3 UFM1-protein ligase 1 n=1 Tax=Carpediemonas membranifera TaxID=201153 RepID=A0A8J6B0M3_9EUKA|nr:E3 UFM1-protein ligase 1 [Carpediemonas membranifera]|eukprot:KAG9393003.1 E3 UFM1-protein ligase 1 [Carpediemonas membranifera]
MDEQFLNFVIEKRGLDVLYSIDRETVMLRSFVRGHIHDIVNDEGSTSFRALSEKLNVLSSDIKAVCYEIASSDTEVELVDGTICLTSFPNRVASTVAGRIEQNPVMPINIDQIRAEFKLTATQARAVTEKLLEDGHHVGHDRWVYPAQYYKDGIVALIAAIEEAEADLSMQPAPVSFALSALRMWRDPKITALGEVRGTRFLPFKYTDRLKSVVRGTVDKVGFAARVAMGTDDLKAAWDAVAQEDGVIRMDDTLLSPECRDGLVEFVHTALNTAAFVRAADTVPPEMNLSFDSIISLPTVRVVAADPYMCEETVFDHWLSRPDIREAVVEALRNLPDESRRKVRLATITARLTGSKVLGEVSSVLHIPKVLVEARASAMALQVDKDLTALTMEGVPEADGAVFDASRVRVARQKLRVPLLDTLADISIIDTGLPTAEEADMVQVYRIYTNSWGRVIAQLATADALLTEAARKESEAMFAAAQTLLPGNPVKSFDEIMEITVQFKLPNQLIDDLKRARGPLLPVLTAAAPALVTKDVPTSNKARKARVGARLKSSRPTEGKVAKVHPHLSALSGKNGMALTAAPCPRWSCRPGWRTTWTYWMM